jgi:type IV pilus assembly protein PilW
MITFAIKKNTPVKSVHGFTLIEILIVLAIVGMMMSAVYAVHIANIRAIDVEAERVEIQQDQRISLDFITRQLRMAGYDKEESLLPKLEDARSNFIYYTADFNADGDVDDAGEHVAFCIYDSAGSGRMLSYITGSNDDVGKVGSTTGALAIGHTHTNQPHQPFAPIQDLEFFYTLKDGTTTTAPTTMQLEDIRSVAVTIVTRADTPDPRWTDNTVYIPASGDAFNNGDAYGDNFRRRMMTANIRFRNLGL